MSYRINNDVHRKERGSPRLPCKRGAPVPGPWRAGASCCVRKDEGRWSASKEAWHLGCYAGLSPQSISGPPAGGLIRRRRARGPAGLGPTPDAPWDAPAGPPARHPFSWISMFQTQVGFALLCFCAQGVGEAEDVGDSTVACPELLTERVSRAGPLRSPTPANQGWGSRSETTWTALRWTSCCRGIIVPFVIRIDSSLSWFFPWINWAFARLHTNICRVKGHEFYGMLLKNFYF